ncbi:hypothetical protein K469DRAFT_702797 [Zopfia rhizophila CBS 207.26]|uniref:SRP9 domain-containing protein n=1 Tax=Zopfia rhizophila CBS 207.26 TaxID=1314779 RepID=A0A6A6EER9_9PEZI|nr:hypothetical protein K469DRAFT_702797 [Zopfia rhizophila CBS 207.26]
MPDSKSSAEWFEQSSLLLKARPSSTRITSKYTVLKPTASKIRKRQKFYENYPKTTSGPTGSPPPEAAVAAIAVTATFKLKTYDPVSGTCLKYQTTKAAEVGRLVGSLGKLGRHMAALPEVTEDISAPSEQPGTGVATPTVENDAKSGGPAAEQKTGGGGGKKKKKGKK